MREMVLAAVVWVLSGAFAISAPPNAKPPHAEQVATGVFAAGFSHRFGDANCGWAVMRDCTLLIDLPRGLDVPHYVAHVRQVTGKPVKRVVLTSVRDGDQAVLELLAKQGVDRVATSEAKPSNIGDDSMPIRFIPYGTVAGVTGGAIFLPQPGVLFCGPAVVNGPHAKISGSNTADWLQELVNLQALNPKYIVPGSGSWGGPQIVDRQRRFLGELRQQVAHGISMGQSPERIAANVRLPQSFFVWMPYDLPTRDDVEHIYRELSAPYAPFDGQIPDRKDAQPHAFVLIGDRVHEPEHLEEGLEPVFTATKVVPHFTVDYRAECRKPVTCFAVGNSSRRHDLARRVRQAEQTLDDRRTRIGRGGLCR